MTMIDNLWDDEEEIKGSNVIQTPDELFNFLNKAYQSESPGIEDETS